MPRSAVVGGLRNTAPARAGRETDAVHPEVRRIRADHPPGYAVSGGRRRAIRGTHVLIASSTTQGLMPGDRFDCVDGELCWILPPCPNDSSGCRCRLEFEGAATAGRTTTVRVARMQQERRVVLRTLRDAAAELLGPVLAARAAEVSIGVAETYALGTFLQRDDRGVRAQFGSGHQARYAAEADRDQPGSER